MRCHKEVPLSMHPKVLKMVAQVGEVLTVFVLCCTSIREKKKELLWYFATTFLGQKIYKLSLEKVDSNGVMLNALRCNDVTGTFQLSFIQVVAAYERVDSG